MAELARLLDFSISVDTGNARATGWYIKENNLFSLDLAANTLIIKGERVKFDPALIEIHKNDIFVDVRLLAKWFPIDIQYDSANLMVVITSREPLPVESKIARTRQREMMANQREKNERKSEAPRTDLPRQWLGWPLADVYTEFSHRSDPSGETQRSSRYNVLMSGDIAKLNAEIFLGGDNEDRLSQARIKLRRMDPDGGMFGPLKATEFQVGDVFTPQASLVSNTQIGRGAVISNIPLDRPSEFDRITLDGDLPVGWEVELYRNEVLLDFRVDQASGRYSFQNVPLLFGVNVLRLMFYGPQGQIREEVKQLLVGPGQIKPGEHQFRIAFNQQDQQVLLSRVDNGITDESLQGKNRLFAEYQTGISRNLSVAANLSSIPFEGGHRNYLGVSGRAFLGPVFGRVDLVEDVGNGEAAQVSAQSSFGGVSVIAEHRQFFRKYLSEQNENITDPLRSRSTVRLDGVLRVASLPHVPFAFTGEHEQRQSGQTETRVENRVSTAIGRASLTNSLGWQLTDAGDTISRSLDGTLLVGGRISDVRLRGQITYGLKPLDGIRNTAVTAD